MDYEQESDDNAGLTDGVSATIQPKSVLAQAGVAMVATITASAEVIPGVETTSHNFPVFRTVTLKCGRDGDL